MPIKQVRRLEHRIGVQMTNWSHASLFILQSKVDVLFRISKTIGNGLKHATYFDLI